ncbi:MAG: hypothetical protein Kow006_30270 [Gammaproteobacteria bacterium]
MLKRLSIDTLWLILMAMTLGTAALAESAEPGLLVTLAVAIAVALKGRIVVDRFMELLNAKRWLRDAMRLYFYVIPLLIVLVYLFPDVIVTVTNSFLPE